VRETGRSSHSGRERTRQRDLRPHCLCHSQQASHSSIHSLVQRGNDVHSRRSLIHFNQSPLLAFMHPFERDRPTEKLLDYFPLSYTMEFGNVYEKSAHQCSLCHYNREGLICCGMCKDVRFKSFSFYCRVKVKISRQKCSVVCITSQIVIGNLHLSITCGSRTMTIEKQIENRMKGILKSQIFNRLSHIYDKSAPCSSFPLKLSRHFSALVNVFKSFILLRFVATTLCQ